MCFVLMLPSPVFSRATFLLAVHLVAVDPGLVALIVGRIAAINTCDGIVGSLVAGFAGLPHLGLVGTMQLLTGLSIAGGVLTWILLGRQRWLRWLAVVAVVVWLLPQVTAHRVPAGYLEWNGTMVEFSRGTDVPRGHH